MRLFFAIIFIALVERSSCVAEEPAVPTPPQSEDTDTTVLSSVLLYLPNRLFDLLDIVRLRARLGPGLALGVRATKLVQANIGGYSTVFVGLPGPRQEPAIPLPVGVEMYAGLALSVAEIGTTTWGPEYSPSEFGVHTQLAVAGFDFGLDPYEIVDFVLGIVFIDPVGDDL